MIKISFLEAAREIAKRMIAREIYSYEEIAEINELSIEEIKFLADDKSA